MSRFNIPVAASVLSTCFLASFALADDAKDALEKNGVRVTSTTAVLAAEAELNSRIRDVPSLRRKLVSATKQYEDHKKSSDTLNDQISRLNQQFANLNAQLANVTDVATNNRLVGAINTVETQLRVAYDNKERMARQEGTLHNEVSVAGDALISHIQQMRKLADEVAGKYRNVGDDTKALLATFNRENGTKVELQPSSVFTANLKKLEDLEGGISSEAVALRRDRNTFWARVKLNEETTVEMIVDSGASTVLLPFEDAIKARINLDNAPKIRMSVADGRTVTGQLVKVDSMQVGQFVAKNVECVVLPSTVRNADPLLGMSFLGNFKFQLDAGKSTLSLVNFGESSNVASKEKTKPRNATIELTKSDWKLIPAAVGAQYFLDKDYQIMAMPEELEDTLLLARGSDNQHDILWPDGEVVSQGPAWVYVALLKQYTFTDKKTGQKSNRVHFKLPTHENLKEKGWIEIKGFETTGPPELNWKWVIFKKKFEPGPIKIPPPITIRTRLIFFVGPADEP